MQFLIKRILKIQNFLKSPFNCGTIPNKSSYSFPYRDLLLFYRLPNIPVPDCILACSLVFCLFIPNWVRIIYL